jgi:hypothetical protein
VVTEVIEIKKQGFAPAISTASAVTIERHPAVTTVTAPLRASPQLRSAVSQAIANGEMHPMPAATPHPEALHPPARTFVPDAAAPKRPKGLRPVREKFNVAEELAVSRMIQAVKVAFDIERREGGTSMKKESAWPFPTLFDRNTDYAPGSVVLRPARPSAAEIQFKEDVADLLVMLAKEDVLGAKLVAYRALRWEWDELRKLDPERRQRWTLDKLRRKALLRMTQLDAEHGLRVGARVEV